MWSYSLLFVFLTLICSSTQKHPNIGSSNSSSSSRSSSDESRPCDGCAEGIKDPANNGKIKALMKSTMALLDAQSSHSNKYILKPIQATGQVVEGMLYEILATLSLTDCAKNDAKEADSCGKLSDPQEEKCDVSIWERSWIQNGRKTEIKCDRSKFSFTSESD